MRVIVTYVVNLEKGSVFAYNTFANVTSLTDNVEQLSPEFFSLRSLADELLQSILFIIMYMLCLLSSSSLFIKLFFLKVPDALQMVKICVLFISRLMYLVDYNQTNNYVNYCGVISNLYYSTDMFLSRQKRL